MKGRVFSGNVEPDLDNAVFVEGFRYTDERTAEAYVLHDPVDLLEVLRDFHFDSRSFSGEVSALRPSIFHTLLLRNLSRGNGITNQIDCQARLGLFELLTMGRLSISAEKTMEFRFVRLVLLGVVLAMGLCCISLSHPGSGNSKSGSPAVLHELRGKVINLDSQPLQRIKVQLARSDGTLIGTQTLEFEGNFAFKDLAAGSYLLTLERENAASVGRTIDITTYPTPKTIFLGITLNQESSSVREIVTEFSYEGPKNREEKPTPVSKKALKAFQLAVEASEAGTPLKAIEYLEKAIREQPNYFEAYNNLGVQYQKLRQWSEAIQAFQRAIELRSDSAKPYLNLGTLYWERGEIESATENFQSARRFDENSVIVHSALGQLYFQAKAYIKAQEHLEMATRLNPKEAHSAFVLLVQLAIINQDPERARQYVEVMLQYFPYDPEALKLQQTLKEP
jgi:tetratricopeptide (TPR) repeat protein